MVPQGGKTLVYNCPLELNRFYQIWIKFSKAKIIRHIKGFKIMNAIYDSKRKTKTKTTTTYIHFLS